MAQLSTFAATIAPIENGTTAEPNETSTTTVEPNGSLNNDSNSAGATTTPTDTNTGATSTEPAAEPDESIIDFSLGAAQNGSQENGAASSGTTATNGQPQPQVPTFNLDEEIKKVNRVELLKKLGVNEFAIEIDTHIANGGQPIDYLNAKAVNYDSISDEDLVKQDLKRAYPNFSAEEISRMYSRKYGINSDMSDEEIQDVNLELKAKGYEIRQNLKAEQQKFKIADIAHTPQNNEAYEQWKQTQDENTRLITQLQEFYNGHPATKSLNESKRVTINFGEGVKPLNFNIDNPELITTAMLDGGMTFAQRSLNDKGEPDVARQQLGAFLALDPQKAVQMIFNYGKSVGERNKVAEGQNAQRPITPAGGGNPDSKPVYKTGTYGTNTGT